MEKLQKIVNATVLATETSHIFCCVLPTIFSVLSLLAGLGVIGAVPANVMFMHDLIHDWEIPIIIVSGVIITFGWWLHDYAQNIDCHDTGCEHGSCEPKKKRSATILKIATVLFMINVTVYFAVHQGVYTHDHDEHVHDEHEH